MSMSTHVYGIRPPDAAWKKMNKARDACIEAGIDIPPAIDDFFDGENPDDKGVLLNLTNGVHACCEEWSDDGGSQGYELDLKQLPSNVTIIRFYNSW
jgi:hypothetical protein